MAVPGTTPRFGLIKPVFRGNFWHESMWTSFDIIDANMAGLNTPVFTGDPQAPTPPPDDNDNSIATTEFVTTAIADAITVVSGTAPATTTELLQGVATDRSATPNAIAALWEKGTNIPQTPVPSFGEGGFFHITGSASIVSFGFIVPKDGRKVWAVFDGPATLIHNDVTLQLPGKANIRAEVGDRACFVQDASGNVICLDYVRASGAAVTPSGNRNRIINGDFAIDQRNNGALVSMTAATTKFSADRWEAVNGQAPGVFSIRRIVDPALPGEYILSLATTTIDASIDAADVYYFGQKIEGFNCRDLNWGIASAKPITISFSAFSAASLAIPISVRNADNSRSWLGTVSTAGLWQRFAITVPGDTTGTWNVGNGIGMHITLGLGIGNDKRGVAGWQAGNFLTPSVPGAFMTNVVHTLLIKDFQVEVGSSATDFERNSYHEQFMRCQRYFQKTYNAAVVPGTITAEGEIRYAASGATGEAAPAWRFPVEMRAVPTQVVYSPTTGAAGQKRNYTGAADTAMAGFNSVGTGGVAGSNTVHTAASIYGYHVALSAEL